MVNIWISKIIWIIIKYNTYKIILDVNKGDQMKIIEQNVKELNFLESSSLKNFKICLMSEFEAIIKELINWIEFNKCYDGG